MAIYREDWADIELKSGTLSRSFMNHSIGKGDNMENRYGVRVFRGGEPESLAECTCQGLFMAPNGQNILISGADYTGIEGNTAWVQLPQACYNEEGQFTLAIKIVSTAVTGTMRIIDGVVNNTGVTGAVAPTASVPTYQEVLSVYEQAAGIVDDLNAEIATRERENAELANGVRTAINGGSNVYSLAANDDVIIKYPFIKGNTYTLKNNTNATSGTVYLIEPDDTRVSIGYIPANGTKTFTIDDDYYAFRLYANATGTYELEDSGYQTAVNEQIESVSSGLNGTKITKSVSSNDEWFKNYSFLVGNNYTMKNGTGSTSGQMILYRKDGTTKGLGYIQAGNTLAFTVDEPFVKFSIYANGSGTFEFTDEGYNTRINGVSEKYDSVLGVTGSDFNVESGTINIYGRNEAATDRIRTAGYFAVGKKDKVIINKRNLICVVYYDKEKTRTGESGWTSAAEVDITFDGYIRIIFRKNTSNSDIDPSEYAEISTYATILHYYPNVYEKVEGMDDGAGGIRAANAEAQPAAEAAVCRNGGYPYTKKIYPQILISTDIHHDWDRLERAMDYNDENGNTAMMMCMGDICDAPVDLDSYNWSAKVLAHEKPIIPMIGNHDAAVIQSGSKTNAQLMAYFFSSDLQTHNGETHSGSSLYWYKDITKTYTDGDGEHTKTLRVIAMNQFEYPDETTDNRSYIWYSQAQINWLVGLLENNPANTYVMIATHEPPTRYATYKQSDWTQESKIGTGVGIGFDDGDSQGDRDMLVKIVHAWINGGTVSISNAQSKGGQSATITVNKTFTAHTGLFAGWICGHTHADAYAEPDDYAGQKIITFHCTTSAQGQQDGDLGRAATGKAQDCVTLVSYDWDRDEIRLVRLGADWTVRGKKRQYVII